MLENGIRTRVLLRRLAAYKELVSSLSPQHEEFAQRYAERVRQASAAPAGKSRYVPGSEVEGGPAAIELVSLCSASRPAESVPRGGGRRLEHPLRVPLRELLLLRREAGHKLLAGGEAPQEYLGPDAALEHLQL